MKHLYKSTAAFLLIFPLSMMSFAADPQKAVEPMKGMGQGMGQSQGMGMGMMGMGGMTDEQKDQHM
ncbi:MAG: hypothetical protein ACXWTK_00900, partial [Methylobacter sp.]